MQDDLDILIANALAQPRDGIFYTMSRSLAKACPEWALLETEGGYFSLLTYAADGHCTIFEKEGLHQQFNYSWNDPGYGPYFTLEQTWHEVTWGEYVLQVVSVTRLGEYCGTTRSFILAENMEIAKAFLSAVCKWCSEVRGEVLVFSGSWYKDSDLFNAIKGSTLDNLVLHGNLKDEIRGDFLSFFDNRAVYEKYGIPWKRGVLLLGPPGNGKTYTIKAIANLLEKPCLYVKSFKHPHYTDHDCMKSVFERARATAPCILVLEDLDSLLDDHNRSFFLNEMDGFASNRGIMTVATTNHPERLDPAILERPSRFDRKYTFHLPDTECRAQYLAICNEALEPELRLTEDEVLSVAAASEEFSFAYLKELFLSAMMEWISNPNGPRMKTLMEGQVDNLRLQMRSEPNEPTDSEGDGEMPYPQVFRRSRRY